MKEASDRRYIPNPAGLISKEEASAPKEVKAPPIAALRAVEKAVLLSNMRISSGGFCAPAVKVVAATTTDNTIFFIAICSLSYIFYLRPPPYEVPPPYEPPPREAPPPYEPTELPPPYDPTLPRPNDELLS